MKYLFQLSLLHSLLLFAFKIAKGQENSPVMTLDSLVVDASHSPFGSNSPRFGKILKFGQNIYMINAETGKLFVLDIVNHRFSSLLLEGDSLNTRMIVNFELGPKSIFCVDAQMNFIYEYDYHGCYISKTRLNRKFSYRHTTALKNLVYNPQRNSFFVSVDRTSTERIMLRNPQRAKIYFQRNDLIVEIDRKGRKLSYFGSFDSLYQQQFYFHGNQHEFIASQDGRLILNLELSDAIQIYNSPHEQPKVLNFRGKFLTTDPKQLPVTQTPYINIEDYYSHRIASYQYQYINLLNNAGLFFRYYIDAIYDSTLEKVYVSQKEQSNPKMCLAPSARKLEQKDLLKQKPWYVQIINMKNSQLVYDGPFPFQGRYLLPSKDQSPNEFYSYDWSEGNFKLYRYELEKLSEWSQWNSNNSLIKH
jgi:hypothetical protein